VQDRDEGGPPLADRRGLVRAKSANPGMRVWRAPIDGLRRSASPARLASTAVLVGSLTVALAFVSAPASDAVTSSNADLLLSPLPASTAFSTSATPLIAKELAVLTDQGITPARAVQALTAQSEVARAGISSEVEAKMGAAFAGTWFEPASAQLHIGATSSASRRIAEETVARAALVADVVVTPVRSTVAQLLAAQRRWNRKLMKLLEREEAKTGLEPQRNAVSVTLTSAVPSAERLALEHQASMESVNVFVTVGPGTKIGLMPDANKTECNKWARNKAYCNPSITSGVTIKSPTSRCTAGPLAIPLANKAERVLLTAGHCIEKVGQKWSALNKAGAESVIGPAENFVFGGAAGEKKGDYADIKIEPAWQTGKAKEPVFAVTAEWTETNEKKEEEISYPVKGERKPEAGNVSCHEGQTDGGTCGEIKLVNVTFVAEVGGVKKYVEGLVEVAGAKLLDESGDSGGPWLFIENPGQEARMEGTLTGEVNECRELKEEKAGLPFFKTRAECANDVFKEEAANKGTWERILYTCKNVGKVEKGAQFYSSKVKCEEGDSGGGEAGEGEWKREPFVHAVFFPLKQPMAGAAEGSLEKLKLELLTTTNEVIPPCGG
jgi:hypothetical protein